MLQKQQKNINKKQYAKLSKLDATCNTILSLLFVILLVIFSLFILDMMGVLNLTQLTQMVQNKPADNPILSDSLNQLNEFIQIDDSNIEMTIDEEVAAAPE